MEKPAPFRLNRSGLLLALVSAAFAGQAGAAAGRVEFALGGANIVGADGRTRTAARGTELDSGDVVRTNDGRVQVRMTDGSYISLQPNTEFGIKEYKFEGKADGTESAFYSLLKGAMRTVTGLIGRTNRNRYQVATPTATVGIRGTGGLIQVLNDGSTLVQGTSGIWFLANPSGSIDIPAGVAGLAPSDPKQPPKETADVPTSGPAPLPPQEGYVQGDERETDGTSVITGNVLLSGTGFAAALAGTANTDGPQPFFVSNTDSAVFNGAGQLVEFGTDLRSGGIYRLEAGGSHADFGTDGILAWGRWIGTVTVPQNSLGTENYSANEGLHYVIGLPTATLPTTGTATYTVLGATQPTYVTGVSAPGTFTGSMTVNFVGTPLITGNFNVAMPDGKGYAMTGSTTTSTSVFSMGLIVTGTTSGSCTGSCSGSAAGFFAGTAAERAGLAYRVTDNTLGLEILGAAAFKKQ